MSDVDPFSFLRDHLEHPRNRGSLQAATHVAEVSNRVCGDDLRLELEVRDGTIRRIAWTVRGCTGARAIASFVSELVAEWPAERARDLGRAGIEEALGRLPRHKRHCAELVADALREALT